MLENKKEKLTSSLAIIGAGPRGLSALESMFGALATEVAVNDLSLLLFECSELPGAGQVYEVGQLDTNWLNVSERGLTIPRREEIKYGDFFIPAFSSYQEWSGYDAKSETDAKRDKFPLRSTLGKYLHERYQSIARVLQKEELLTVVQKKVVKTSWEENFIEIVTKDGNKFYADEVLLTIGHQPTNSDEQISDWVKYSKSNSSVALYVDPYPVKHILKSEVLGTNSIVAIRGFGLAMIDVVRALTLGLGGTFQAAEDNSQRLIYLRSGREPKKMVPYSLDGLPMAPKPLNAKIDQWFFPTDEEKEKFETELRETSQEGTATNIQFLIDSFAPIALRVFMNLGGRAYTHNLEELEVRELIKSWLFDKMFAHDLIVPTGDSTEKTMESFVIMALGSAQISLDFCIGHVWRHCQPSLYKAVSFSNLADDVIGKVVALDERLKRYSYGPPVGSLQQLLALIRADMIALDFVNDPDIETTSEGWKLSKDNKTMQADIMVNSVLDSPKLLDVNSPIIENLLQESAVEPVHGQLGIDTHQNAIVSLSDKREIVPLAVLGRLAKGSLIGVDAILECFGNRSELWAEGFVSRIYSKA